MDNFIIGSGIIFVVPFFTTIGVVAPLKNDPILLGRSIWLFRHLEHQNPSIISDFRHRDRMPAKICENLQEGAKKSGKVFFSSIFHHHGGGGAT